MVRINVGIVGFGMAARVFHLPLLRASHRYALQAIVSSRPTEVRALIPTAHVVRSIDELILLKPTLIIIATPSSTHFLQAKRALEAGIHVVVEKPFVCSTAEGEELIELSQRKGVVLSVFHNRRWDNGFLTASHLLKEGSLGSPRLFLSRFDRFRPIVRAGRWRESTEQGGGHLLDLGSHLVDQALHLFGRPDFVWGDLATQRDQSSVEDFFEITMAFGKVRVRLQASSFVQGEYAHLELHGTSGSYRKCGLDPQEEQGKAGMDAQSVGWGIEPEECAGILTTSESGQARSRPVVSMPGSYATYYQLLAETIMQGGPIPVSAQDALEVIKILDRVRTHTKKENFRVDC